MSVRVAIVMPEIYFGGAETQFRELVGGLAAKGSDLTVFVERSYQRSDRDADDEYMRQFHGAVKFELLSGLATQRGIMRRILSTLRFRSKMRRRFVRDAFDVVIVYSGLGAGLISIAARAGISTIFSERNSGAYTRFGWLTKGRFIRGADAVAVNSPAGAAALSKHGIKAKLILNGLPIADEPSLPVRPLDGSAMRLLVPARIAKVKGQLTMVCAAEFVSDVIRSVTFAGAVEDKGYLTELKRSARANRKVELKFVGYVKDMRKCYASADLVVLPSYSEGMPNVLLESMALKVLCVASDIPSHRLVLHDSRLLFTPGDADGLAAAIQFVHNLGATARRELIEAHSALVRDNFSTEVMVTSYLDLLTFVVRSRKAAFAPVGTI